MTDYLADAIRQMESVDPRDIRTEEGFDVRGILAGAQVSALVAIAETLRDIQRDRQRAAADELTRITAEPPIRSIPWPLSIELVRQIRSVVTEALDDDRRSADLAVAAVLHVLGGEAVELPIENRAIPWPPTEEMIQGVADKLRMIARLKFYSNRDAAIAMLHEIVGEAS